MSLKKVLLGATMLALPLAAQAQPVTGLYIGAGAMYNAQQGTDLNAHGTAFANSLQARGLRTGGKVGYEPGFGGVLSLGWGFGNGLRAEVEGSYRENDVKSIRGFGGFSPTRTADGTSRTYGVMGNVLYDLSLAQFGLVGFDFVQPYIGGGAGVQWNEFNVESYSANPGLGRLNAFRTEGRFAYQGIAGLAFPIASVPGLAVTTEYRYLGLLGNHYIADYSVGGRTTQGRLTARDNNQSFMVGLRYALFQPAPPPPPVAPPVAVQPAPARTYLVFFDWDRADLTARAREIIRDAAGNSRQQQVTRLEVNGYTDRSGTTQYNQGLSMRRANAVAAELVRDGVPRGAISIHAFGESNPLVPTADGVREPQNRRVEIILR